MRARLWAAATLAVGLSLASVANAAPVVAHLTADNHYGLFFGSGDGSSLTFIGRNEYGPNSSNGSPQWETVETWNFDVSGDEYIYVYAWDESPCCRMWIGDFRGLPGGILVSRTADWEFVALPDSMNPGSYGDLPQIADIQSVIAQAVWATPQYTWPYGRFVAFPEIDARADQIWHADINPPYSASGEGAAIFRARAIGTLSNQPNGTAPEPGTLALAAIGLIGLGYTRRRKQVR